MIPLGPFDLHEVVATGGMGEVWRGHHRAQGVPVAVKVLRAASLEDPFLRRLFRNEARTMASLSHPNVVLVFDYGQVPQATADAAGGRLEPGNAFLVFQHVH